MNGVVFDIKRYAIHDGPGIRTTVFLKGCPLDCCWCHNPESRLPEPQEFAVSTGRRAHQKTVGCLVQAAEVVEEILQDRIFYDQSGGGVTFSGGEPMLQIDFLTQLLTMCRQAGLHTAVDTSGQVAWESFARINDLVDLFLYDLKVIDDSLHKKYTGASNKQIKANLKTLAGCSRRTEVRVPLIPTISDTDENLTGLVDFLSPLPALRKIALLPFNKLGRDKVHRYSLSREIPEWETQSADHLGQRRQWLERQGFEVTIGG
ncbi:MAG: glycyl-radical enzyme activating protein [bacterium]